MLRLTLVVLNGTKTAFFVMNFIKVAQNHCFRKMRMKIWYDRFNWRNGIRYSYILFCAKSASISLIVFLWISLRRNNIFGKSFKSSISLFVPGVGFFSTFSKYDITILLSISHGNSSPTSYILRMTFNKFNFCCPCSVYLGMSNVSAIERRRAYSKSSRYFREKYPPEWWYHL